MRNMRVRVKIRCMIKTSLPRSFPRDMRGGCPLTHICDNDRRFFTIQMECRGRSMDVNDDKKRIEIKYLSRS